MHRGVSGFGHLDRGPRHSRPERETRTPTHTRKAPSLGTCLLVPTAVAALAGVAFIYSGAFNAAADEPHSGLVISLAQAARERSIAAGASEYVEMCTGCHLAPGMEDNEMRPGRYPYPPNPAAPHPDGKEDHWRLGHLRHASSGSSSMASRCRRCRRGGKPITIPRSGLSLRFFKSCPH